MRQYSNSLIISDHLWCATKWLLRWSLTVQEVVTMRESTVYTMYDRDANLCSGLMSCMQPFLLWISSEKTKLFIIGTIGLVLTVIITLGLNKLPLLGYFLLKILILSLVSSWFNRYRNTYEHNLCLDMLKEGFHQSFRELFNLMEKQKADIGRLGTDSGLSDQPLLENEPAKLDQLKHHLTTAEAAKRRGEKINSILSIRYSTNHCLVSSVGLG